MTTCQFTPDCQRDGAWIYSDPANGKPDAVSVCKGCLYAHVRRHYPGGAIHLHLEDNFPELKEAQP